MPHIVHILVHLGCRRYLEAKHHRAPHHHALHCSTPAVYPYYRYYPILDPTTLLLSHTIPHSVCIVSAYLGTNNKQPTRQQTNRRTCCLAYLFPLHSTSSIPASLPLPPHSQTSASPSLWHSHQFPTYQSQSPSLILDAGPGFPTSACSIPIPPATIHFFSPSDLRMHTHPTHPNRPPAATSVIFQLM